MYPPLSPEIYHKMLVKLKISDQKYVNFFAFSGVAPPFRSAPFQNFWIRHCTMLVRGPNYMYYDINGDEISYVKL
jgi:hypothetical protein